MAKSCLLVNTNKMTSKITGKSVRIRVRQYEISAWLERLRWEGILQWNTHKIKANWIPVTTVEAATDMLKINCKKAWAKIHIVKPGNAMCYPPHSLMVSEDYLAYAWSPHTDSQLRIRIYSQYYKNSIKKHKLHEPFVSPLLLSTQWHYKMYLMSK